MVAVEPGIPKHRRSLKRIVAIALAIVCAFSLVLIAILTVQAVVNHKSGDWHLSARNTAEGLEIRVHQSDRTEATYTTVLAGHATDGMLDRVRREDLPPAIATTTFYDVTLKPGRWALVIDGVELDIMESRMVVDGNWAQTIQPTR